MILQLNPVIPVSCPKGHGYANFLIDRGMEFDIEWVIFLDSGEIWNFRNRDVRLEKNITYARTLEEKRPYLDVGNGKIYSGGSCA